MGFEISHRICSAAQLFCIKAFLNFIDNTLHPYNWFSHKWFERLHYGWTNRAFFHLRKAVTIQPHLKSKKFLMEWIAFNWFFWAFMFSKGERNQVSLPRAATQSQVSSFHSNISQFSVCALEGKLFSPHRAAVSGTSLVIQCTEVRGNLSSLHKQQLHTAESGNVSKCSDTRTATSVRQLSHLTYFFPWRIHLHELATVIST